MSLPVRVSLGRAEKWCSSRRLSTERTTKTFPVNHRRDFSAKPSYLWHFRCTIECDMSSRCAVVRPVRLLDVHSRGRLVRHGRGRFGMARSVLLSAVLFRRLENRDLIADAVDAHIGQISLVEVFEDVPIDALLHENRRVLCRGVIGNSAVEEKVLPLVGSHVVDSTWNERNVRIREKFLPFNNGKKENGNQGFEKKVDPRINQSINQSTVQSTPRRPINQSINRFSHHTPPPSPQEFDASRRLRASSWT